MRYPLTVSFALSLLFLSHPFSFQLLEQVSMCVAGVLSNARSKSEKGKMAGYFDFFHFRALHIFLVLSEFSSRD